MLAERKGTLNESVRNVIVALAYPVSLVSGGARPTGSQIPTHTLSNVVAPSSVLWNKSIFGADVTESASVLGLRILWSLGMQDESHVHCGSTAQDGSDVMADNEPNDHATSTYIQGHISYQMTNLCR